MLGDVACNSFGASGHILQECSCVGAHDHAIAVQWDAWGRLMQTFANTTSIRECSLSFTAMPTALQQYLFPPFILQRVSSRASIAQR